MIVLRSVCEVYIVSFWWNSDESVSGVLNFFVWCVAFITIVVVYN